MARTLSLIVRNLVFTVMVPGLGGAWVPWWILTRHGRTATPDAWEAVPVIAAGAALYVWCVWNFAAVGRGTPGPWDAPFGWLFRSSLERSCDRLTTFSRSAVTGGCGRSGSLQ